MTHDAARFSVRGPMRLGLAALILLLGGFGAWATLVDLSGAIVASGRIEVDQNRQVVQHPDGGVVHEILVTEGMRVAEDQVLIRLDPATLQSQLAIIEGQLFELMARRGRHEAERDGRREAMFDPLLMKAAAENPETALLLQGQRQLLDARGASLASQVEQLHKRSQQIETQIEGIASQRAALVLQLGLITRELSDQQSLLNRGLAQSSRVLALQREMARLNGQIGALTAEAATAESRITETQIEILRLFDTRREEAITRLRDLQFREMELGEQRRALALRLERLDIRAPVAGLVHGLKVFARRAVEGSRKTRHGHLGTDELEARLVHSQILAQLGRNEQAQREAEIALERAAELFGGKRYRVGETHLIAANACWASANQPWRDSGIPMPTSTAAG